ncbi:MaoC family dehydratase [Rhizorhabdus dicambivorans]|uniref:Acyl dehydratase n=1 Tax=Rhizorhabdus dicambivorans TaxID=1850238 RepID=A0A2A4G0I6_9SPHN|nr:MaoC family dehydratase [Rhizorhabdus dicambivorans]ATE66539.1 acyl dehydratase [Rhizorhabdus dicambivorans]PCE43978.1 acyl dehydratase [Rhizorhabdus dicambivorans]
MTSQQLTSPDNYFEDFTPGQKMRHARGKTIGENETVILAHLTMNTAQGHFNAHDAAASKFGRRITYGGVTASIVVGLASEDTSENALADVALDKLRLRTPVVEGDTLYSVTEVLACAPSDRPDAGLVTFRHYGYNQRDEFVCQVERTVLVRRRPTQ